MALHPIVIIAGLVVLAVLAALFGAVAYTQLKTRRQGYPYEDEIEATILPYAYEGIMGAYKASEYALDEFGKRLQGADKAEIARLMYNLIPERIVVRGTIVPVKTMVSQRDFERYVIDAFDRFLVFYTQNCQKYETAVQDWARVNR